MGGKAAAPPAEPGTGYLCEYCDREFTTERGAAFHELHWCPKNPDADHMGRTGRTAKAEPNIFGGTSEPDIEESAPVDPAGIFDEPAPEPAKRPWRDKVWGSSGPKSAPLITAERKPRKRRTPTDGVWTTMWTILGVGLVRSGADVPVGNCLQFQAPVVGGIFDDAIKGTFIDTLVQPIAGSGDRLKKVSAVISMPVLVGIMERSPGAAATLEPILREVIREHLVAMAPVVKARQKADTEYKKALTELGLDVGEDPVDSVIEAIWAQSTAQQAGTNGHAVGADVQP